MPKMKWKISLRLHGLNTFEIRYETRENLNFMIIWFKTLTLSKPLLWSLLPRTSPIPARSVTGFSFIGSATKFLCFWDVVLILLVFFCTLTKIEFLQKTLTVWCNFTVYSLKWQVIVQVVQPLFFAWILKLSTKRMSMTSLNIVGMRINRRRNFKTHLTKLIRYYSK